MKYGIIILFILSYTACRSNSQLDKKFIQESKTDTKNLQTRIDQSETDRQIDGSKSSASLEIRDIRTVSYREDGTISSIQDERRSTGSIQLDESRERSTGVSMKQESDSSITSQTERTEETVKSENNSDSRPVQGTEWLWITIPVSIILLAIFIILFINYKHNRK